MKNRNKIEFADFPLMFSFSGVQWMWLQRQQLLQQLSVVHGDLWQQPTTRLHRTPTTAAHSTTTL